MARLTVVQFSTGPSGCGKTYVRCARFVPEFLIENETGDFFSNYPWRRHEIARYCASKTSRPVRHFLRRLRTIRRSDLERWRLGESGPWEYFREINIDGAHIAVDEIHNYCPKLSQSKLHKSSKHLWQNWLGEIRHCGATVEFISQSPQKVSQVIGYEAEKRVELVSMDDRRDPYFKIELADWQELKAAFSGRYVSSVGEIHYKQLRGRWREHFTRKFKLLPEFFRFYDSFSTPIQGGQKSQGRKREFEKRGRLGLCVWFLARHFTALAWRLVLVAVIVWLSCGGGGWLLGKFPSLFQSAFSKNQQVYSRAKPIVSPDIKSQKLARQLWPNASDSDLRKTICRRSSTSQPVDEVEKLRGELQKVRADYAELQAKVKESFAVVLISGKSVTFRSGYTYREGDTIDYGPYRGKKIVTVNSVRRCVALSDGFVLRMSL